MVKTSAVPAPPLMVSVRVIPAVAMMLSLPKPVSTDKLPVTALTSMVSAPWLPVTVAFTAAPKVALKVPVAELALMLVVAAASWPRARFWVPLVTILGDALPLSTTVLAESAETMFRVSTPAVMVTVPPVTLLSVRVAESAAPATAADVLLKVAPAELLPYFNATPLVLLMLLVVNSTFLCRA